MKRVISFLTGLACMACLQVSAFALDFLDVAYSPDIPALETVIGHAPGENITRPEQALAYLSALQAAAPQRMQIRPYAKSWQGRDLVYAIISSPGNMKNLDTHKANIAKLASGMLGPDARARLAAKTPAVVWLSYGVHGDEISSTDAALALAYHILAAKDDKLAAQILDETILIIDPMQNPDGRARFVHSFESSLGLSPRADRYAAEHDQPWPGGRYNHYLFDLNRDWFSLSQPETRGKIKAVMEWNPAVLADVHEMSGDNTYFFAPAAEPFNPNITKMQRDAQTLIGRNHAKWFDKIGSAYFTREVFDQFYPGYGDMWPTLNGAIAMTYEQGSARGLIYERKDGSLLTYKDGVKNHFISSLSTAETVAKNKAAFLNNYADYRASAISQSQTSSARYYLIDKTVRPLAAKAFAGRLGAQGIQVQHIAKPGIICGTSYKDGAYVVDSAQPNGRLIKSLLDTDTPLPDRFIKKQEDRRARGLPHELYDVTAWSVPLMDGLNVKTCARINAASLSPFQAAKAALPAQGKFGYIVPWADAGHAKLVLAALEAGLAGKSASEAFTIDGREYPKGSTVFANANNSPALQDKLRALARQTGAELIALDTSWVDDGPNFGSGKFASLRLPRAAMAWGDGTIPTQAGAARFIIERELGLPVTPIRVSRLGAADLDAYDVLILPAASRTFSARLGGGGADALRGFTERGGVLIAIGDSIDKLAGEEISLLATQRENASREDQDGPPANDSEAAGINLKTEQDYRDLIADPDKAPDIVPGVLTRTLADPDHWLASGYDGAADGPLGPPYVMLAGDTIYRPLNAADGTNVLRFAGPDQLMASGYLWEENRKQIAFKPVIMAQPQGKGIVIGFTQSPVTRAYLNGQTLLLANAILLGPAHMQ